MWDLKTLVVLVFGLLCVYGQELQETEECNAAKIDECGYMIGKSFVESDQFPTTEEERKTVCIGMKAGHQCLLDLHEKCPNFIPTKIVTDFIETVKSNIVTICDPDQSLHKKIITNGICIRQALIEDKATCMTEFHHKVEAARVAPKEQRLAAACCAMVKYDKCFYDSLGKKCNRDAARTGRRIVQGFAIFMADKCLGYLAEPKKCAELPAIPIADNITTKTIFPGLTEIIVQS